MTGAPRPAPRDDPESLAHHQSDPVVLLSPKDPQDLERLRTYFLSAPYDWYAEAAAEMPDIKRGK